MIYPDSDDPSDLSGNGVDGTYDRVEYRHNRQAERIAMKDQNETVHSYTFDKRGRSLADEVLSFGTGIDQAVAKIARSYNVQGQVELITSYDGSSNVVNQVKQEYNAFGQLIVDWQQHDGAVTGDSLRVGYTYTDATAGHARLIALTYPNGRLLHFGYAAGADDAFNRVTWLADDNGSGSPGMHWAEYAYLGLGGIVQVDYAEPQIRYDLDPGTAGTYAGLDEFGRVKDLLWRNYGTSQDVVRIKHGYDRAGNRLWREDAVAAAQTPPVHLDELYTYDGINRLVDAARGDLNANKDGLVPGTKTFAEAWGLDSTGNWSSFNQDTTGGGWALEQTRDHSPVNEIADIDETAGPSWVTPSHDRAGNMTVIPQPADPTSSFELTWDAWNRLVKVEAGANTVGEYQYDGDNRRTLRKAYETDQLDYTRRFYHTIQWQAVEERVDASASADRQYVWGLRYIDDLVLRDRDADVNSQTGNYGKPGSGLEERLYALQDPNWNVAAVTDENGDAKERYLYAPYGTVTICNADWSAVPSQSAYGQTYLSTGRQLDAQTGLYCLRARFFSYLLGRFISRDPAESLLNLYLYSDASPLTRRDPWGLWTEQECKDHFWGTGNEAPGFWSGGKSDYDHIASTLGQADSNYKNAQEILDRVRDDGGTQEDIDEGERLVRKSRELLDQTIENQRFGTFMRSRGCCCPDLRVYVGKFIHEFKPKKCLDKTGVAVKASMAILKKLAKYAGKPLGRIDVTGAFKALGAATQAATQVGITNAYNEALKASILDPKNCPELPGAVGWGKGVDELGRPILS